MGSMKVIKNKKCAGFSILSLIIVGTLLYIFPPHFGEANADTQEWTWQVSVAETLSMSVSTPTAQTGDPGKFLRESVNVTVASNNGGGYNVKMGAANTNLANGSVTIPTLATAPKCADANCAAFPANYWGYSTDDTSNTGTYKAVKATASADTIMTKTALTASASQTVWFGAKADASKASGTYTGTVTFTATSGAAAGDPGMSGPDSTPQPGPSIDEPVDDGPSFEDPGTSEPGTGEPGVSEPGTSEEPSPVDPSISEAPSTSTQPSQSSQSSASGSSVNSQFAYSAGGQTYRSEASTVTEVAENSKKPTQSGSGNASDKYVSPLGVNEKTYTSSNVQRGSIITTILMCVAFCAAGVGILFFILAKRRDDEEEEEDQ